ncbi:hypothetical protein ACFE04_017686 [Oxalis oulophora]
MKFCKKYQQYLADQEQNDLPGVGFKKLKKLLKKCRKDHHFHQTNNIIGDAATAIHHQPCPNQCSVCDGTFFPALLNEMSAVVGCFNERARKLLELHLASGVRKYVIWLKGKLRRDHACLIQEGKELVTYALINATAIRKILKKYDKVHYSKQGQVFKSQAQSMHIEILQSPWLCELMAFHINLRETKINSQMSSALFEGCTLKSNDDKLFLMCELFDSVNLSFELTCSICLDTVFDPVSLTCGHIFCYMCACSAAKVTTVDGIKAANPTEKCPLCREAGVFEGTVHMEELCALLNRSCPEYYAERLRTERIERLKQAKEHWDSLGRAFVGV